MECPICGAPNVNEFRETRRTSFFGLENVLLRNIVVTRCAECGEEAFSIPKHNRVMREIRKMLCMLKRELTGSEFAFLRNGLNISGQECAHIMGVTNVSISRWETGAQEVNSVADKLIRILTLEDLGKGSEALKMLINLNQRGIDAVEVDLSHFSGASYRYETCESFGNGNSSNAWMLVNG